MTGDKEDTAGYSTLCDDPGVWILAQEVVDDGIADLVADFIRMSAGYGL
jgi:hypothetical protein